MNFTLVAQTSIALILLSSSHGMATKTKDIEDKDAIYHVLQKQHTPLNVGGKPGSKEILKQAKGNLRYTQHHTLSSLLEAQEKHDTNAMSGTGTSGNRLNNKGPMQRFNQSASIDDHTKARNNVGRDLSVQKPFSFYVMGDTPYRTIYKAKVQEDLQHLKDGHFIVHVGGMNKPLKHRCSDIWFNDVHTVLRSSPIPVLAVPGNKDCPVEKKGNFNKYFVQKHPNGDLTSNTTEYFEDNWNHDQFLIHRQSHRMENWSFKSNKILFIGLNMVAQHDLGANWKLIKDNEKWALSRIQEFNGTSVVMFGYQRPGRALLKPLFETINRELLKRGIAHFLYVHGSGYKYQVEQAALGQMTRVQVDKGAAAPPLKITVNTNEGDPSGISFEFDRRL